MHCLQNAYFILTVFVWTLKKYHYLFKNID